MFRRAAISSIFLAGIVLSVLAVLLLYILFAHLGAGLAVRETKALSAPPAPERAVSTTPQPAIDLFNNPNPYLSFLPEGVQPNYTYWNDYLAERAERIHRQQLLTSARPVYALSNVDEQEPNDDYPSAMHLPGVGTSDTQTNTLHVNGALAADDPVDFFRLDLRAGDVLGVTLRGNAQQLALYDASGNLLIDTVRDISGSYSNRSPLPRAGREGLAHVAHEAGAYYLGISSGSGSYELDIGLFRPPLEEQGRQNRQLLFLDFDGATVDLSIVPGLSGVRELSPFSAFLADWGLNAADEAAAIDAIVQTVVENIVDDVRGSSGRGKNGDYLVTSVAGDFAVQIFNSRDHGELFGQPNVSRVIIGGTRQELGANTIGLAQSIDVGNFDTEETAFVLLDLLSQPGNDKNSLNRYTLDGGKTIIDLIGVGVGNLAAHEAGHLFGNVHTHNANPLPNLMDRGGNMPNLVGVGGDSVFGNDNDVDVDYIPDIFEPTEFYSGWQETLQNVAFVLPTGIQRGPWLDVENGALHYGGSPATDAITLTTTFTDRNGLFVSTPLVALHDGDAEYAFANVQRARVATGAGNDRLHIAPLTAVAGLSTVDIRTDAGDDTIFITAGEQLDYRVNGGTHNAGDALMVDAQGQEMRDSSGVLATAGGGGIAYEGVETLHVNNAPVDVAIDLTVSPEIAEPGMALAYRLTLHNRSAIRAEGLRIALNVPEEVGDLTLVESTIAVSAVHLAQDATEDTTEDTTEDAAQTWQLAPIAAGETVTLTFAATLDAQISGEPQLGGTAALASAQQLLTNGTESTASVQVNIPPMLEIVAAYGVDEGESVRLVATVADIDRTGLRIEWDLDDDGAFDDGASGNNADDNGSSGGSGESSVLFSAAALDGPTAQTVRVRATDRYGATAIAQTRISVHNVAPRVDAGGPYVIDEGAWLNLAGTAQDVAADELSYAWDWDGDGETDTTGATSRTAVATLNGPTTVTVTLHVRDDEGASSSAQTTLTVRNVPPAAGDDYVVTVRGEEAMIDVLRNDSDPGNDVLTLVAVERPLHGQAQVEGDTIVYRAPDDFDGEEVFEYTVRDADGATATGTVSVVVLEHHRILLPLILR